MTPYPFQFLCLLNLAISSTNETFYWNSHGHSISYRDSEPRPEDNISAQTHEEEPIEGHGIDTNSTHQNHYFGTEICASCLLTSYYCKCAPFGSQDSSFCSNFELVTDYQSHITELQTLVNSPKMDFCGSESGWLATSSITPQNDWEFRQMPMQGDQSLRASSHVFAGWNMTRQGENQIPLENPHLGQNNESFEMTHANQTQAQSNPSAHPGSFNQLTPFNYTPINPNGSGSGQMHFENEPRMVPEADINSMYHQKRHENCTTNQRNILSLSKHAKKNFSVAANRTPRENSPNSSFFSRTSENTPQNDWKIAQMPMQGDQSLRASSLVFAGWNMTRQGENQISLENPHLGQNNESFEITPEHGNTILNQSDSNQNPPLCHISNDTFRLDTCNIQTQNNQNTSCEPHSTHLSYQMIAENLNTSQFNALSHAEQMEVNPTEVANSRLHPQFRDHTASFNQVNHQANEGNDTLSIKEIAPSLFDWVQKQKKNKRKNSPNLPPFKKAFKRTKRSQLPVAQTRKKRQPQAGVNTGSLSKGDTVEMLEKKLSELASEIKRCIKAPTNPVNEPNHVPVTNDQNEITPMQETEAQLPQDPKIATSHDPASPLMSALEHLRNFKPRLDKQARLNGSRFFNIGKNNPLSDASDLKKDTLTLIDFKPKNSQNNKADNSGKNQMEDSENRLKLTEEILNKSLNRLYAFYCDKNYLNEKVIIIRYEIIREIPEFYELPMFLNYMCDTVVNLQQESRETIANILDSFFILSETFFEKQTTTQCEIEKKLNPYKFTFEARIHILACLQHTAYNSVGFCLYSHVMSSNKKYKKYSNIRKYMDCLLHISFSELETKIPSDEKSIVYESQIKRLKILRDYPWKYKSAKNALFDNLLFTYTAFSRFLPIQSDYLLKCLKCCRINPEEYEVLYFLRINHRMGCLIKTNQEKTIYSYEILHIVQVYEKCMKSYYRIIEYVNQPKDTNKPA